MASFKLHKHWVPFRANVELVNELPCCVNIEFFFLFAFNANKTVLAVKHLAKRLYFLNERLYIACFADLGFFFCQRSLISASHKRFATCCLLLRVCWHNKFHVAFFLFSGNVQRTGNFTFISGGGTKRVCRDARVAVRAAAGVSRTAKQRSQAWSL